MSDLTIRGISFTKDIALACIIDGSISDCHIEQYKDAPILLKRIFYNKDFSNPAAVNKYLHILLADLIEFVEDRTMGESTTKFPQDVVCRIKVSDESYEDDYIGVFWNLPGIGETSVLPDYYIAKYSNFAKWEQIISIINTRIKLGYVLDWNGSFICYEEEEASDTTLKVYNELTENDTDSKSTIYHLGRIVSIIKAYRRDITFPEHLRVNVFYWPETDEGPASIELSCPTSEKDYGYIQIPDIIDYLQEEGKQKATLLPVRYQIGRVLDWDRIYIMGCDYQEVISTIFDKLELAPKGANLSVHYKFEQIIKNIKSYCMDSFYPDANSTVNVYYRPQTETIELFTQIEDIELVSISDLYNYIHTSNEEEQQMNKEESIHDDIRIESIRVFSSKYKNHEGDGVLMARNEILYGIEDNEIVRYRIRDISVRNENNETKYCFEVVNFDSNSLESKTLYEDDLGVTLFGSYNKAKEKLSEKDFFKQAFVLIPKGNNNAHLYIDGEEYIASEPPILLDNGECTRIDITGAINFVINERLGKDK